MKMMNFDERLTNEGTCLGEMLSDHGRQLLTYLKLNYLEDLLEELDIKPSQLPELLRLAKGKTLIIKTEVHYE